ncbi:hypothetical protein ACGFNU_34055 [Spirillospora sp. NPDC048911]|uniref:hypothetical protein n=1 Tax=Spirillospora sp. NPDC048911 TaxID=3364527 RepID=UPI003711A9E3
MNDTNLEDALASALNRHAGRAPTPPADLTRRIAVKHRRRRITRATGAVTFTAMVVGALGFGLQEWDADKRPPSLTTPTVVTPKSAPIEKQWPGAVGRIPDTLADGTHFTPHDFIDDRTILIATWRSSNVASALLTYDVKTHRTGKLDLPVSAKVTATEGFTAGSGRVGWLSKTKKATEIWTAPLSGGPATRLYTGPIFPAADVTNLTLTGNSAYWSLTTGGVFRVPLTGGTPAQLPGTKRFRLMTWPWAGGPAYSDGGSVMADMTPRQQAYKDILNLVTGERRSFTTDIKGRWTCAVTWCVDEPRALSRDGRRIVRPAPGHAFKGGGWAPVLDRFVLMGSEPGMGDPSRMTLVDLETGRGGTYGHSEKAGSSFTLLAEGSRLHHDDQGKSYLIIDLSKIS